MHCHGITGDGAGPTAAFLNPYPRDYRKGVYKFKSSKKGSKPTHEDLKMVLMEGIAGTAMPSFKLLPDQEVEALLHYVRYLTARGEVERKLFELAATDLAPESAEDKPMRFYTATTDKAELKKQMEPYVSMALEAVASWDAAVSVAVPSPQLRNAEGKLTPAPANTLVELTLQMPNQLPEDANCSMVR